MKKLLALIPLASLHLAVAQVRDYDPSVQPVDRIQYFKPAESHLFVGDCMPFDYRGTFYLYWLIDEGHHAGLGGLGGHQWALSTSEDMVHWKHYPVALGIDNDWEKSICTGSVIDVDSAVYAFYSTRVKDDAGVHEQLSFAVSHDGGFNFEKQTPNPFFITPERYESRNFRDPKVFRGEDGAYHLFISSYEKNIPLSGFGGCLVHLVSEDLKTWREVDPVLTGQVGVPECSDYFLWKGWYYLLYCVGGDTYYVRSKKPFGPWEYPSSQAFVEGWANVYKTAPLKDGRRVAAAFIPWRGDGRDHGWRNFGGNLLLREVFQGRDGMLYTRFLEEALPSAEPVPVSLFRSFGDRTPILKDDAFELAAPDGTQSAFLTDLPANYRLTMTVDPRSSYDEAGLFIRAKDNADRGYKLELNALKRMVLLHNLRIEGVTGLDKKLTLDIVVREDMIDVCIGGRRCVVNRLPESEGRDVFFFVKNGTVEFRDLHLKKLN